MNELENFVSRLVDLKRKRIVLVKVPEPVIICERIGAKVSGRLDARRACDFLGALEGGRAVAIECKSTRRRSKRWHLDNRFQSFQRPLLERWAALGVWCAVYVRHATYGDFFVPVTRHGLPFAGVSCEFSALEAFKIPQGLCFVDAFVSSAGAERWPSYQADGWDQSSSSPKLSASIAV